ncbi:NAD-dependent epimerase/dehydratase family protein [Fodinibius salsisoli]|uniref:NAD-dependent epimerase/dehydratase family protein n=1 Tax=Fodinibius salsisoli TaxID=2820877 RepID=A0ABT3PI09_9BACT|nr:NAD-dependent epimerase/dehydratase family protein [Fodinibius salsisoli]MCW9705560.1 NAD-dependent epimerase/dehydratase family protein [Fodinibius salsisoli]
MDIKDIFVTGVTGYIGGSIAHRLLENGYKITGLVRSADDVPAVEKQGINAVTGSINEVETIRKQVQNLDAVVNAADADNPFVVATILEALRGTEKTLIHTTGSSLVGSRSRGEKSDIEYHEDMPLSPAIEKKGRVAINRSVLSYAARGMRPIAICPPMIYGQGLGIKKESIQVPWLIELAKEKQQGAHIGKGANRWSHVHIDDLVDLYLLAMEQAPAGSFFYAENGEASLKDIAQAIGRMLDLGDETTSISIDEAIDRWGPEAAHFAFGANSRINADKARKLLGWNPKHRSILDDIEEGSYKQKHNPRKFK